MVMSGAAAVVLTVGVSVTPASAVTPQPDPERYSTVPTAWGSYASDKHTIDAWLNKYNGRVIDVERTVYGGWSVITVDNNNPTYTRTPSGSFSWTVDESLASLKSKLNSNPPKRLLDVESYTVGSSTLYAAAWVDNVGISQHDEDQDYEDVPIATIDSLLDNCNCHIADLEPVGGGKYDVIIAENEDWDSRMWAWDEAMTEAEIRDFTDGSGYRLVDIEPAGGHSYAVVFVHDAVKEWSFGVERTWNQLTTDVPAGHRPIHLKEYKDPYGQVRWLYITMKNG